MSIIYIYQNIPLQNILVICFHTAQVQTDDHLVVSLQVSYHTDHADVNSFE